MSYDDRMTTKGQARERKKESRRAKEESGSMTAFYRHEEVNKGRLKSKVDRAIKVRVRIQTKKKGSRNSDRPSLSL